MAHNIQMNVLTNIPVLKTFHGLIAGFLPLRQKSSGVFCTKMNFISLEPLEFINNVKI